MWKWIVWITRSLLGLLSGNRKKQQCDNPVTIAVDAMGGDNTKYPAPQAAVLGALKAVRKNPNLHVILVGDEDEIEKYLPKKHPAITIRHADGPHIKMDDDESVARAKKNSSMQVAINIVKNGEAKAVMSCGNTKAYTALCLAFKRINLAGGGKCKIALGKELPARNGHTLVMDLGGTAEYEEADLVTLAQIAAIFVREVRKIAIPRIGLLSIGSEAGKGNELIKKAGELLQGWLNFGGNAEPGDIRKGKFHAVIADGFTGNIHLKSFESGVKESFYLIMEMLEERRLLGLTKMLVVLVPVIPLYLLLTSGSILEKILNFLLLATLVALILFLRTAIKDIKSKFNGALVLGIKGLAVKGHGDSSPDAFAAAINAAYEAAASNFFEQIENGIPLFEKTPGEITVVDKLEMPDTVLPEVDDYKVYADSQTAYGLSLGSAKGNAGWLVSIDGMLIRVIRIAAGSKKTARKIYHKLDGMVASFGIGGTDLGVTVDGKFFPLRDIVRMVKRLLTPAVDGSGLKATLEPMAAKTLAEVAPGQHRIFFVSGAERWPLVMALKEAGHDLLLGDLFTALGIKWFLRPRGVKVMVNLLMPIVGWMPFEWLYPTGEKQKEEKPGCEKICDWANVIVGDKHVIRRFCGGHLLNKIVITNTTTKDDRSWFKDQGVACIIVTTPMIGNRSFGTNVAEAMLNARYSNGKPLSHSELGLILTHLDIKPTVINLRNI